MQCKPHLRHDRLHRGAGSADAEIPLFGGDHGCHGSTPPHVSQVRALPGPMAALRTGVRGNPTVAWLGRLLLSYRPPFPHRSPGCVITTTILQCRCGILGTCTVTSSGELWDTTLILGDPDWCPGFARRQVSCAGNGLIVSTLGAVLAAHSSTDPETGGPVIEVVAGVFVRQLRHPFWDRLSRKSQLCATLHTPCNVVCLAPRLVGRPGDRS